MRMVDLDGFNLADIDSLKLSKSFRSTLSDTLGKIDACHKELKLAYVFLFGSAARGEAVFGSDLDILLLTDAKTEREVRLKVYEYGLDDDVGYIPVQITVRKTVRFKDEETDVCDFNQIIFSDLKLLRRYIDD